MSFQNHEGNSRDGLRLVTLKDWVESMTGEISSIQRAGFHSILSPVGLRIEDGAHSLTWDRITLRDESPRDTRQCLWDFVNVAFDGVLPTREEATHERLVDYSRQFETHVVSRLIPFIQKWGLFDFGDDFVGVDDEGECHVNRVLDDAREARDFLVTLVATVAGTLVSEDVLWTLRNGDNEWLPPLLEMQREEREPFMNAWNRQQEELRRLRRERWRAIRMAGQGLDLQRSILVGSVARFKFDPIVSPVWDERGRRVETTAFGVREIVGAQLLEIFASDQLDVYTCDVCSIPYEIDRDSGQRRPRSGARHFCSDHCRTVAKRESNRATWHRHKDEWRKPGKGEES